MNDIKLKIEKVSKDYGNHSALKSIDLEVKKGELLAILGPSGCGKTTLLMIIAGLIPVTKGKIYLDGKEFESLAPQKRKTTLVFQNYALFPHMTVKENIQYGLKVNKYPKEIIVAKTKEILKTIELEGLEDRRVSELSGGQQQRVALGRAIVVDPSMLLYDEPLSNLDEKLRATMRKEISRIHKKYGITSIYVTHDQNEAMEIADRVVVMKEGTIEQISKPNELYYFPKTEYVANFIGHKNVLEIRYNEGQRKITVLGMSIDIDDKQIISKNSKLLIRAEEIDITSKSPENMCINSKDDVVLSGKIINKEMLGSINKYLVKVFDTEIEVVSMNKIFSKQFEVDEEVILCINKKSFHFISKI